MKILIRILIFPVMSLLLLPCVALSQESGENISSQQRHQMSREERRAAWDNMSAEEKQAKRGKRDTKRAEMRARMQTRTPEQRDAKRDAKRAEMRARMQSITPEQRDAKRAKMRTRMKTRTPGSNRPMKKQRGQRNYHERGQCSGPDCRL